MDSPSADHRMLPMELWLQIAEYLILPPHQLESSKTSTIKSHKQRTHNSIPNIFATESRSRRGKARTTQVALSNLIRTCRSCRDLIHPLLI